MLLKSKNRILGLSAMISSVFVVDYLLPELNIENNFILIPFKLSIIILFVWGFFTTLFNELEN